MWSTLQRKPRESNVNEAKTVTSNLERYYSFDINNAFEIFDHLLMVKFVKLAEGHKNPLAEELKKFGFCK